MSKSKKSETATKIAAIAKGANELEKGAFERFGAPLFANAITGTNNVQAYVIGLLVSAFMADMGEVETFQKAWRKCVNFSGIITPLDGTVKYGNEASPYCQHDLHAQKLAMRGLHKSATRREHIAKACTQAKAIAQTDRGADIFAAIGERLEAPAPKDAAKRVSAYCDRLAKSNAAA